MGRIAVVVSPGTRRTELIGRQGGAWKVRVAAPPERGRANEALCGLLAERLRVPRRDVRVAAGAGGRRKLVEVAGLTDAELETRLAGP